MTATLNFLADVATLVAALVALWRLSKLERMLAAERKAGYAEGKEDERQRE